MDEIVTVREARARGISHARLQSTAWERLSYGIYGSAGHPVSFARRCRAVARALPPGTPLSHWTAARLLGLWLPRPPDWLPLMATLPPGVDRPERQGLYVARARSGYVPTLQAGDIRLVSPEVCVAQLAEDLRLVDLVIAIDSAMSFYGATVESILADVRARQRGLPALRKALTLVDERSESPWETVLRLIHVTSGIDVQPQAEIRDADGVLLARGDLLLKGTRRLAEYDGADHRDKARHESDLARDKLLARLRLERYGYIKAELVDDPGMVVRDAETALGLPHVAGRVAPWRALAQESATVSPEGYRLLLWRLRRYTKPLRGRGARRRT